MKEIFQVKSSIGGDGYDINIGTKKTFHARELQEVVYALQHYFRKSIAEYPFDYEKHIEHAKVCDCCPLCRK